MTPQRKVPYLIQRVGIQSGGPKREGIDAYFGFDYMGSAEFEYGALPKALRQMRDSAAEYPREPMRIKDGEGRIVWYVGPEEKRELAREIFDDQSYDRCKLSFKERTKMSYAYQPEDERDEKYAPAGWWAIDQDLPWLLFQKKEHAKEWIKRMKAKK